MTAEALIAKEVKRELHGTAWWDDTRPWKGLYRPVKCSKCDETGYMYGFYTGSIDCPKCVDSIPVVTDLEIASYLTRSFFEVCNAS